MSGAYIHPGPHCKECGRNYSVKSNDADKWNGIFSLGVLTGLLCPKCQTPEENTEAEINAATLDYSSEMVNGQRVFRGWTK